MNEETNQPTEDQQMDAAIDSAISETIAAQPADLPPAGENAAHTAPDASASGSAAATAEVPPDGETAAAPEAPSSSAAAPGESASPSAAAPGAPASGSPDFSKEQELFDRAVRAGISIKDVLAMPDAATVERITALVEKTNSISPTPNNDNENEVAGTPDDDLGVTLEEMEKDGEYDPKIVRLLKGLYQENAKLRAAGQSAARASFFDQQFGSLDESLRSHVDAVRKSQLKQKFDLLEAGYKALGSKIQREDVFQEAARLALGDLMGKQAEERKTAAIAQRKNLTLARPNGENGHFRRENGPVTEEDIASEIWDQINR